MNTEEKVKQYLNAIEKDNKKGKKINAILEINSQALEEAKEIDNGKRNGKLRGKVIVVKSNINVKGMHASCASKTLEDYKATYDATVVEKLRNEGAVIIGMSNMDEFAAGGSGETSAFGATENPNALGLIPGGSSSGSAASVAAGFCDIALGSDTGGSIRNPASHCGVVGLKPSYSSVSRYGLIDLSMSLDQIGPIAKNVKDVALLFDVIRGKDKRDAISQDIKFNLENVNKLPKEVTIGLLDLEGLNVNNDIKELIEIKTRQIAKEKNWKIKKVKLNYLDLAIETYYPLVYVEFFSGTRKFDGRRYGKKIEDSAGREVLRRILGGSEISKAEYQGRYYHLALKAKQIIAREFEKAFKEVDVIICPTVPRLPHEIGSKISVEEMYSYDVLTVPSSLAGNCAISLPIGKLKTGEGIECPVGMQIICDKFQEEKLFQIANVFEKIEKI